MNNVKKIFIFFFITSIFVACSKEDDTTTIPGSTGPSDPRNVFVGTWLCNEESQVFGTTTYSVDISVHSTITNRIVVSNFYNLGFQASNCQMEVSGNSITIFQQNLSGYNVLGSGILANNSTINLSYDTDDGSGTDHVTAVYNKTH